MAFLTKTLPNPYGLKALLTLAWPVVVARSSQAVVGFCDALMSAPLGEDALAAVTTGAMNTFMVTLFPTGLVFISQSFAAQLIGRGNPEGATRYAWYALGVSFVVGVVSALGIPLIDPLMSLLDYTPAVHAHMGTYLQIRTLSFAAVVGMEALGNWYGGTGNTRLHMLAGVTTMVVNIFLNWVLIGGNLGAPAMGVTGAALASAIAAWVGFGVLLAVFLAGVATPVSSVRPKGLTRGEFWRLLRFGTPHGINWFLEFAAFALFLNVVVAKLGTTVLAAMMVVININSVSFMPAFGLSSAGAILTGQAIGAGEHERVPFIVKRTLAVAATWQLMVGSLYLAIPGLLMRWFARDMEGSDQLVLVGTVLLGISAAWQLFDSMAICFGEILRSAGDTTWPLYARLVIAWFIFVPCAFAAVFLWDGGYVGAMLCVVLYIALLAMVLLWRFSSGAWKHINLTGEPELV